MLKDLKDFFETVVTMMKSLIDVCVVMFLSGACINYWTDVSGEISDMEDVGVLLTTIWCSYKVGYAIGMIGVMIGYVIRSSIRSRKNKKKEAFRRKMEEITL